MKSMLLNRLYTALKSTRLLAVIVVLLALWPLTTFLFPTKWDNLDCFLPYRHFVSFAFHNGEWPFWNPFQHLGYPAYSDMQNGMYNPVLQLLFLFGVYNPVSLNVELTVYYLFAVFGIYKFAGLFVRTRSAKLLAILSFTLSGFMMGTAQIMVFIAGAAFLPHILYHTRRLLVKPEMKQALYLALFLTLHVTAASPSFTIVLIYILAGMGFHKLSVMVSAKINNKNRIFKGYPVPVTVLLLSSGVLLAAYTVSVWEFWPYFSRTEPLPFSGFLLANPFDFKNYVSFLFPLTTLADSDFFQGTDLTMRSGYFGLLPLLLAAGAVKFWREPKVRILIIAFFLFLILAGGAATPVYRWFYELPGFGLFRHPAMFRIHFILAGSVLAAISLERLDLRFLKKAGIAALVIAGAAFISGLFQLEIIDFKALITISNFYSEPIQHQLSSYLVLNAAGQLILLTGALIAGIKFKIRRQYVVACVVVLDMLCYALITSPYTLYLNVPLNQHTRHFEQLPEEFDQTCTQVNYKELEQLYEPRTPGLWRNTATLHKSLTNDGSNPTQMKGYLEIESNGGLPMTLENPLFYDVQEKTTLPGDTNYRQGVLWSFEARPDFKVNPEPLKIENPSYTFNTFHVQVANNSDRPDLLVLNQNYHELWSAVLNDEKTEIFKVNQTLQGVIIPAGFAGSVTYSFDSPYLRFSFVMSVIAVLVVVVVLVFLELRGYLFCE